ncbi:MAG: peptidoglycan bridge formation glycyltransferase FemA/FemB family protein [Candidatus Nealsonbacteria bacterium]|nr:peptidoglycan bridge formation glycyltransferase FemA/FemB family protein [Candidatus Nealsonbacteria bacterium]
MNSFRKIEDKAEWQSFLQKAPFKTFFHSLEWEEFLEKEFSWLEFNRYLYKDEVLLSFGRYSVLGKRKMISHPFCEYGGPLPLKENLQGREFKEKLLSEFNAPFKISFHPHLPHYFQALGLKGPYSSRDTYLIKDIHKKEEEEVLRSFRKTLRHSIETAQEANILVRKCENEKELRGFYELYLKTVKGHKSIPYPFSFFKYFLNSSKSEIILAQDKERIIAGSVFLFYKPYIHYFINASDLDYRDQCPNHLILWTEIKKYLKGDYEIFDLGGTRRGSSLEIFKRGWGAGKYPIFELKNYSEGRLKKSKMRDVLGLMPTCLAEGMSKFLLKYKL